MSPVQPTPKPTPTPTPIPTPIDEDDYADMPCLMCGECHLVHSKGGYLWEAQFPSEIFGMCQCDQFGDPDNQDN